MSIPKGYEHHEYAALKLCQVYVNENEGHCVHCKWFEMHEPAVVWSKAKTAEHTKEDALAQIKGDCHRFPPQVCVIGNDIFHLWPEVLGSQRCREFKEEPRCAEEICLAEYCEDES